MKSLIVVHSYHHNNTQKVAQAMAKVLDADAKSPQETVPDRARVEEVCKLVDAGFEYVCEVGDAKIFRKRK